jgi:hypothetical protein
MRLIAIFLLVSCANRPIPSTPDSQLAARFASAHTKYACPVDRFGRGERVSANCIDTVGTVWSACAWNGCGVDPECRALAQQDVMAESCGGPEWPPCEK